MARARGKMSVGCRRMAYEKLLTVKDDHALYIAKHERCGSRLLGMARATSSDSIGGLLSTRPYLAWQEYVLGHDET